MPDAIPAVRITRTIEASPARVFEAWTDPALLHRWLAPHPYEVREATTDVRPGGRYVVSVVDTEGNVHTTSGEYREIVPGRRLVKTWSYDGPFGRDETPSIVTVDLREVGPGVTELTLTHERLRDRKATEMVGAGWPLCLDKLAALFEKPTPRS